MTKMLLMFYPLFPSESLLYDIDFTLGPPIPDFTLSDYQVLCAATLLRSITPRVKEEDELLQRVLSFYHYFHL